MIDISVALKVVNVRNCPFYEVDDWFVLTGQSVQMPAAHPTCLVLVRELTNFLFTKVAGADTELAALREEVNTCGGCTGLIKFQIDDLPEDIKGNTGDDDGSPVEKRKESGAEKGKKSDTILSGMLEEISSSELLQFFHMHQKTGKLMFQVPEGTGRVAFREGAIIGARFEEKENKEAIFVMLGVNKGRFSFVSGIPDSLMEVDEIGDFMMLLMEGIKRLDEEGAAAEEG